MEFDPIDHYFGRRISPDCALFLAYLLHSTREGHLSVSTEGGKLFPPCEGKEEQILAEAERLPPLPFIVREGPLWYLRRNFEAEQICKREVARLLATKGKERACPDLQGLNPEQRKAVVHALSHSLTLISGGPGTGKSYTASCLIRNVPNALVAAPTGKAAANLRAKLPGVKVQTLHRLLYEKRRSELIVVDEASMIGAEEMAGLLTLAHEKLVLFGDPYQLPPIEGGALFSDLVHKLGSIELKECLRTDLTEILELSQAIKEGKSVPLEPLPNQAMLKAIAQEPGAMILTPLRKGPYGSDALNALLHEGQKRVPIMMTSNDAEMDLYNGDLGVLEGEKATFGEREFPSHLLGSYSYAYVLSVHKAQGSEYERVHLLLPEGSERFGREMLYTAVTRAKKKVTLYGESHILCQLLQNRQRRLSHWLTPVGICTYPGQISH